MQNTVHMTKFPLSIVYQNKLEAAIAKQAMEACEQVLSEMGAELHDDLVQRLSVLRLHLDKLERSASSSAEIQHTIQQMQYDFQAISDAIRKISRRLHHVRMDDDPFEKSLEMLCQNMNAPGSLRIHSSVEGRSQKLAPTSETYLIRMIQELIHNALRHSAAWHVWVRVWWQSTYLQIEVEDDGSGFAKINEFIVKLKKKHNTLRMRAQAIGATIQYKQGEKGLLAIIRYPLTGV